MSCSCLKIDIYTVITYAVAALYCRNTLCLCYHYCYFPCDTALCNIFSTSFIMCVNVICVLPGNKKGCDWLIHPGFSNHTRKLSHMGVNTLGQCDDLIVGLIWRKKK